MGVAFRWRPAVRRTDRSVTTMRSRVARVTLGSVGDPSVTDAAGERATVTLGTRAVAECARREGAAGEYGRPAGERARPIYASAGSSSASSLRFG
jgi:hypothetical protein